MGKTILSCREPLDFGCLAGLQVFAVATGLVFAVDVALPRDLSPGHRGGDAIHASVVFQRQKAQLFEQVSARH